MMISKQYKETCMKVIVYAKSAMDLNAKLGAYAYYFRAETGEEFRYKHIFQKPLQTMTQADCNAFVNALHKLATFMIAPEITELMIITDSGKVQALLETYKAEKHCEAAAQIWREKIKPIFQKLENVVIKKMDNKVLSNDKDSLIMQMCMAWAYGELKNNQEILK